MTNVSKCLHCPTIAVSELSPATMVLKPSSHFFPATLLEYNEATQLMFYQKMIVNKLVGLWYK